MRCPDCNKFVAFDAEQDPESDVQVDDSGAVTGTVSIVNNCQECGQELKRAEFDVDLSFVDEVEEHKKTCEMAKDGGTGGTLDLDFSPARTERMEDKDRRGKRITNSRYMKHMYGAEGEAIVTCSCGEEIGRATWGDEVQGSGMEEMV